MVGAYLGWQLTLMTILLASLVGTVVGLIAARGRDFNELKLPFGVFLGIGAVAALLAGEQILDWYLSLFRGR